MSIIGKILYKFYYAPKAQKQIISNYGGIKSYNLMLEGEREMKDYALKSLTLNRTINKTGRFKLHFLTGEKFLHQTLFCIYSFYKHLSKEEASDFSVVLFDDGSLSTQKIDYVSSSFPGILIIPYETSINNLHKILPSNKFPFIHKKRKELFFFNKIFFLHTMGEGGLKIYLDSDMLFLKRPEEILTWLYSNSTDKNKAIALEDIKRSYGYTDDVLKQIDAASLDHKINAGFYGMHTESLDFHFIENKIKELEENHGSSYYMEQFITSILLTRHEDLYILPKEQYIVFPTKNHVSEQVGILHHYVDISKYSYFTKAWNKILEK